MIRFLAAFFTAALAGIGVGGGGLYVIYLSLIEQMPQLRAQGVNLAFFIASALSSMLFHFKKRNIHLPMVLLVGLFGAAGSLFGAFLAQTLNADLLTKGFGAFLTFCGLRTFFRKNQK